MKKFKYNYYLGTPETEESFTVNDGKRTWTVKRNEDWCYNGWLAYKVNIPDKTELVFSLYLCVYSLLRCADSQDYGIAFDPFEDFWRYLLSDVCNVEEQSRVGDTDIIIEGVCEDETVRRIESLYSLLEGSDSDIYCDLRSIAKRLDVPLDINACASDIGTEGSCYRQKLFDSVFRAISPY